MKILIYGAGYVGYSNAIGLALENSVDIIEPNTGKCDKIRKNISPIKDEYIYDYLKNNDIRIGTYNKPLENIKSYDCVILALPTDYDENLNDFDTSILDNVLCELARENIQIPIVIKSTVPIGYTKKMKNKHKLDIYFSPEFLREGTSLKDFFFPSRIIVGGIGPSSEKIINIFTKSCKLKEINSFILESKEAEAIKLFSNSYLAMRVAFMNEIDTYCAVMDLKTESIISGMCSDPRIGYGYNNPSFGYGGYCLPKDTKQLKVAYNKVPESLITAIVDSNKNRKNFIIGKVLELTNGRIGIYRLLMKKDSDNIRDSAIIGILDALSLKREVIIYEPLLSTTTFSGCKVYNNFDAFAENSDLIVSNRMDINLKACNKKVFTRDIYGKD